MDDVVRDYIDAIDPEHRPLFDRIHQLILEERMVRPDRRHTADLRRRRVRTFLNARS